MRSPALVVEVSVNMVSIRALTWGTLVAALLSAILMASGDAALPDLGGHATGARPALRR